MGRFLENFGSSRLPIHERVALTLRNLARRLFPRPAECCGHHGEPGC